MEKQVLQIEGMEAATLLNRFNDLETAIKQLAKVTNQTPAETEYITRRELAKQLKISLVTVHDWTKKGVLRAYKIGKRVYYKPAELDEAMILKGGAK